MGNEYRNQMHLIVDNLLSHTLAENYLKKVGARIQRINSALVYLFHWMENFCLTQQMVLPRYGGYPKSSASPILRLPFI